MKKQYATVRKLKLTSFEIRIAINSLNVKRLKQKADGLDPTAISNLILHFLDEFDS